MATNQEFHAQIVVVGSHAPGLLLRVHRFPMPGETVLGWGYEEPQDGGKGSNQAVVASRLGVKTSFVGCVGQDRIGDAGEQYLIEAGVDVRYLYRSAKTASGVGFNMLDDAGVPEMVTSMGANAELSAEQVNSALADLQGAQVLLTQFEIRPEVALQAVRTARSYGMQTVLNPAPAVRVPLHELGLADILVPNGVEGQVLLGLDPGQEIDPLEIVVELRKRTGAANVIVTIGEKGAVGADALGTWRVFPPPVEVVDTSGAGDAFCAALAAAITRGQNVRSASQWACQVSALSCTRLGTIPAFPNQDEVDQFIRSLEDRR